MARVKVLISGGGIAGNALAFWLSKVGHSVTVVERFPRLRASGLQVDLRGHGIDVLRRMGLEQTFRAKAVREQGIQMVDRSGKRWAYLRVNRSGKGLQSFSSDFEIMRGDLCRILYDATKDDARYIFGTSIESFEEKYDAVEVLFADGEKDRFDLLIGADGQGSHTRRKMLGPETDDGFRPLGGLYIGYFTAHRPIQESEEYIATSYNAPGRRFILTRRHSQNMVQVYLACNSDSDRLLKAHSSGIRAEKDAMADVFRGAGWQTHQILQWLEEADDFYLERMGIVKLNSWSCGRIALTGDAAYCPSASTGMGTTSAIVGAYVLAGEIARHCGSPGTEGTDGKGMRAEDGVALALKAYEQKFRPFMDRVQRGLENPGRWSMLPSTSIGVTMMNSVFAMASYLGVNAFGEWGLREDVGGWVLPEYEEMVQGRG
ncbi:FAD/NAD(P)-binding domain-containing protein [Pleurostoma richardsiae]|uniref:FAD/NAD(P)-binding domain-containing protein n=1 Tax=Pleurostoma richardsiae TaxID=41990 RepID=A0AA38RLL5_9PEZI|nr:FAD/NAD(P)-binding domain-containing protein [Pleurostoma richardsiae]